MTAAHANGDASHLQAHTRALVAFIAEHGPWTDDSGCAFAKLYADATAAGLPIPSEGGLRSRLTLLARRGLIERTMRGKRTYSIGAPSQNGATRHTAPPELPPAPEAPPTAPAANDDAGDAGSEDGEHATTSLPASPLVGTVRLELELDPAMARLVLDLIERGQGIRPIDRDTVQLIVDRKADQLTKRSSEGMGRVLDRLAAVEVNVTAIAGAVRQLGGQPATVTRTIDAASVAKATKPDFRVLGVKDSQQRRLLTDMALDGWTFERANNGHVKATKDGHKSLQLACTPSDKRTTLNDRARARQAGAAV